MKWIFLLQEIFLAVSSLFPFGNVRWNLKNFFNSHLITSFVSMIPSSSIAYLLVRENSLRNNVNEMPFKISLAWKLVGLEDKFLVYGSNWIFGFRPCMSREGPKFPHLQPAYEAFHKITRETEIYNFFLQRTI